MRYHKDDLPREKMEIREKDQLPHVIQPNSRIIKDIIENVRSIVADEVEIEYEKSPSKTPKKKSAKVHKKTNKSAVAKI